MTAGSWRAGNPFTLRFRLMEGLLLREKMPGAGKAAGSRRPQGYAVPE